MLCPRCQAELPEGRKKPWCEACEVEYDGWSRQHATDIIWSALGGMVVVMVGAVLVPLLGANWVWATTSIVGGAGAIIGITAANRRRRRGQFLHAGSVPRAYLPGKP